MNISLIKLGSDLFINVYIVVLGALANYAVKAFVDSVSSNYMSLSKHVDVSVNHVKEVVPLSSLLTIEISCLFGSLAAGYVIRRYAKSNHFIYAGVLGAILTLANVANILGATSSHPTWLIVITTLTFIPMAVLGCSLAVGKRATVNAFKGLHT